MNFPLINVSKKVWSWHSAMEYLLQDEYIYTAKESYYEEYLQAQLFCDCNGNIFKVVDKVPPTEGWRKALRFLPNVYKTKIIFERTGKKMEVEELRNYLLEHVGKMPKNDFRSEWLLALQKAKNHEELICIETG